MSSSRTPKVVPGQYSKIEPIEPKKLEFKTLRNAMRLALGTAMIGADEITRRLKEQQEQFNSAAAKNTDVDANTKTGDAIVRSAVIAPDETEADRLRFAVIGIVAQTPNVMAAGLSAAGQISGRATRIFSKAVSPVANSRLMKPVKERYDSVAARGESVVDRWIEIGRAEEQAGRVMATSTANKTVDELVDYLGQKPEVRELIQQQSTGMFDELIGEVQLRAAGADTMLEQTVRRILRRPNRKPANTTIQLPASVDIPEK